MRWPVRSLISTPPNNWVGFCSRNWRFRKLRASNECVKPKLATPRMLPPWSNSQNIPARTELGREIRKAFIAETDDRSILSADNSHIELRILAHLSRDATL